MYTKDCSTKGACPFAFAEESENLQNYGCLPEPLEIVEMRVRHGKTWACHANPTKPCAGALRFMKERNIPCKVIDTTLVTEDTGWSEFVSGNFYESDEWKEAQEHYLNNFRGGDK